MYFSVRANEKTNFFPEELEIRVPTNYISCLYRFRNEQKGLAMKWIFNQENTLVVVCRPVALTTVRHGILSDPAER